jgi:hypothetical protein
VDKLIAGHSPGPWKWVYEDGDYWRLVDANGAVVCDDGSACGEYNREIEPDSDDGRLIQDAPAAALALALICAGKASVEDGLLHFDGFTIRPEGDWNFVVGRIGWDRCRAALEGGG